MRTLPQAVLRPQLADSYSLDQETAKIWILRVGFCQDPQRVRPTIFFQCIDLLLFVQNVRFLNKRTLDHIFLAYFSSLD